MTGDLAAMRRLVAAILAGSGTACTGLAVAFHGGIAGLFAGLSTLFWISAFWLAARPGDPR